jgi:hypothetical protein
VTNHDLFASSNLFCSPWFLDCKVIVTLLCRYSSTLELMRSRAQEQLSAKKSLIDKLYQDIAAHKHDLLLLQKQTDDVQKQQEVLEEYLKVPPPPPPLGELFCASLGQDFAAL